MMAHPDLVGVGKRQTQSTANGIERLGHDITFPSRVLGRALHTRKQTMNGLLQVSVQVQCLEFIL